MPLFGAPDIEKLKANKNTNGLFFALKNHDPKVRTAALHALGELAEPRTVEWLVKVVQTDKDKPTRITAIQVLGAFHENPRVCDALITTAKYNPDMDLRYEALCAFRKVGNANSTDALVDLSFHETKKVGGAAILALLALGDAGVDAFIERILKLPDRPRTVRDYAGETNVRAALDGPEGDLLLGPQSPLSPASIGKIVDELVNKVCNESVEFSLGAKVLPHVTHLLAIRILFDRIKTDSSQIQDHSVAGKVIKVKRFLIAILEKVLEAHLAAMDEDTLKQISEFSFLVPDFRYEEFEDYACYHPDGTYLIPTPTLTRLAQEELQHRSAS
jgi:hypothetical protein